MNGYNARACEIAARRAPTSLTSRSSRRSAKATVRNTFPLQRDFAGNLAFIDDFILWSPSRLRWLFLHDMGKATLKEHFAGRESKYGYD